MAETVVSGAAGGADFKVGTQSYKTTMRRWRVRVNTPLIDTTVFSDEPNVSNIAGPTTAFFDVSGIMKVGAVSSGPLIPPPQGAALTFQAQGSGTSASTISFTGNFEDAEAERIVNSPGLITGSGRSTGAIVTAWQQS